MRLPSTRRHAGCQRRRCHDIEVPRVGGQVIGGAFNLKEYRGLKSAEVANTRYMQAFPRPHTLKLRGLLHPVARHVLPDARNHGVDRARNTGLVCGLGQRDHRVTHDQRRLGRIEQDNRFRADCSAELLEGACGRLGEFVDVGSRARPCRSRSDCCDNFRIVDRRDAADGRDDRDRRLSPAGHHVQIVRAEVRLKVHDRDGIGAERRGRQVDHTLTVRGEHGVMAHVRLCGSCIEEQRYAPELRALHQAIEPAVECEHAHTPGPRQPVRAGIDANEYCRFQKSRAACELQQQIRADIPGSEYRHFDFGHAAAPVALTVTLPRVAIVAA